MYLYIGQEKAIFSKDIVGVFDLDNATVSKISRDFLNKAEKSGGFSRKNYKISLQIR